MLGVGALADSSRPQSMRNSGHPQVRVEGSGYVKCPNS
jgi:hypothetical protein